MRYRKSGKRSVAIRAVLDTNIWVSAILNPAGFPKFDKSVEAFLSQNNVTPISTARFLQIIKET